eukprot:CAMPEP_0185845862 /NCGR_PEP_ID=MMETSP1354-20130828/1712_1 /TAXON_ID=708628 /ORGANISM="Erythrolobus madagascarensis, Strain CCMP3276" /LENGTH=230 /DNA_ID=CAMNT_0028545929 /DNA_START=159 /DNA_END=851 /DNA_ORIENTATION=+
MCVVLLLIAGLAAVTAATETRSGACPVGQYLNEYTIQDYAITPSIPVGGAKYKMLRVPSTDTNPIPSSWFGTGFDDSAWPESVLPFGDKLQTCTSYFVNEGVQSTVGTLWPIGGSGNKAVLFVRDTFVLPGAAVAKFGTPKGLLLEFIVDNDLVYVGLNGQSQLDEKIMRGNCDGVTKPDSVVLDISKLQIGENLLTIHAEDRHVMSYLNYRIIVQVCEDKEISCEDCSV